MRWGLGANNTSLLPQWHDLGDYHTHSQETSQGQEQLLKYKQRYLQFPIHTLCTPPAQVSNSKASTNFRLWNFKDVSMPCQPGTCWLEHASSQNSPSQASTLHELWTSRCSSWILKRQRNKKSNCQHLLDHQKSKRVPEKHLLCFIGYAKAFDFVDHNKLWTILKEMGIPDHLICLLRNLYARQEATVRHPSTGHGTADWFQISKGVCQSVYFHPAYLIYMQSISWEMLGWMKHKLESRLLGEI